MEALLQALAENPGKFVKAFSGLGAGAGVLIVAIFIIAKQYRIRIGPGDGWVAFGRRNAEKK